MVERMVTASNQSFPCLLVEMWMDKVVYQVRKNRHTRLGVSKGVWEDGLR